jgi:hypothetical protein
MPSILELGLSVFHAVLNSPSLILIFSLAALCHRVQHNHLTLGLFFTILTMSMSSKMVGRCPWFMSLQPPAGSSKWREVLAASF